MKVLKASLILAIASTLFSCSKQSQVTLQSMRPAEITFPSDVNTLLLLDRTKPENKTVNILEGILTGETPFEDRAGAQEALNALHQALQVSPRFKVVKAAEYLTGNSVSAVFPPQLEWAKVLELCTKYNAQAIVALEIFDSNFIVTNGKRVVKKKVDNKEIEQDEFYAEGVGSIKIGFRLYDLKNRTIIDQQLVKRNNTWQAVGSNPTDAVAKLISKSDATIQLGKMAGDTYANKIAPMPITIVRNFYTKSKKSQELERGARMALVNDWKGAINMWERGLPLATNKKDAGRICYNIAVAYEVLGEYELAKKWAQKAFVSYNNKQARSYPSIIDARIASEKKAEKQME